MQNGIYYTSHYQIGLLWEINANSCERLVHLHSKCKKIKFFLETLLPATITTTTTIVIIITSSKFSNLF